MAKFNRIATDDSEVDRLQRELERVLRGVSDSPILAGRLLTVDVLSADYTNLSHGLGRIPTGWFLVAPTGNVTVWEDADYPAEVQRSSMLRLKSSSDTTVKVWVF